MSDYLEVLLALVQASPTVHSMATYLSEGVLLHPELSRFSSAHLAAACLLNAQIILRQDYPWPMYMEKATGFSLSSLSPCSLMIFKRCLTKEFSVADHRGVELCAIVSRYSNPSHHCISKQEIMSLEEFSEQLGVTFDPATSTSPQRPTPQKKDGKVLSFLSDSCYLSSPLWFSGSDSESESEPDLVEEGENVSAGEARGLGSDGERSGFLCAGFLLLLRCLSLSLPAGPLPFLVGGV
ncbi:Cyclin-F [Geodia barretti]|nr:Cyclin-F [Geodia barretti]